MKVKVCDVCYYGEEKIKPKDGCKLTPSKWTHTIKYGAKKIILELCEEHKDYLEGMTFDDADAKVAKLYGFQEDL